MNDISPRFEIWQGKTKREKETFSRSALSRMEWSSNKVILHFLVEENFITLTIKQFKWKMRECTAVKNRVCTSNCVSNPTEKYLTSYIKFGLLKNRSQITCLKENRDCVCPWEPTENSTNTYIKYFYTVSMNQIAFNYVEQKKKWPNFYGMFGKICPFLPLSPLYLK